MVGPRFVVFKDSREEFRFRLVAPNGEIIAASQGYDEKSSCFKGIDSLKRNVNARIIDLSSGEETIPGSKFEVFKDSAGEFRFRLIAANEEIITASQGYNYKVSCTDGIESLRRHVPVAEIEDTTPTISRRKKRGLLWLLFFRLVYSYHFRGMWWKDVLTGSDNRRRYPYRE